MKPSHSKLDNAVDQLLHNSGDPGRRSTHADAVPRRNRREVIMKISTICAVALTTTAAITTVVYGGITLPDAVFYGRILIDCQPVTAQDEVKVIATIEVSGEERTVGTYKMGARAPLGDYYALRIPLESGADGSSHADGAARVGDTVHIAVQQGDGTPQPLANVVVTEIGLVSHLNLKVAAAPCPGDADEDLDVDLFDFSVYQRCFSGPGGSIASGCEQADFDGDNDVDLDDWSGLHAAFVGPW